MNAISSQSLPGLSLPGISFFGRSFDEYLSFFNVSLDRLRDLRILDVAAGPSSFTAEAPRHGIDAVAADPMYGLTPEALAMRMRSDFRRMFEQMRAKSGLVRFRHFRSIEQAEAERKVAAQRFLQDYPGGFAQGRYVGGALPDLPFEDASFDLVLCAHLLFLYERHLTYHNHLAACVEMVRLSRAEVRIHPLVGLSGKPYPALERLRKDLLARGIDSRIERTTYEFFAGTDSVLVLTATRAGDTSERAPA